MSDVFFEQNQTEVENKKELKKWQKYLIIVSIVIVVLSVFGGSNSKLMDTAEAEAKSIVTRNYGEIPNTKAESVYSKDRTAIVKVSYSTASGFKGTFFFKGDLITGKVYSDYRHSVTYDYEMSNEELNKIKAEWKMK